MKRLFALLLAFAMFAAAFALVACGETPADTTGSAATSGSTDSGTAGSSTATATATENSVTATTAMSGSAATDATASSASTEDDSGYAELDGLSKHPDYMDVNFGGKTFNFIVQGWWTGGWDCYEIDAEITGNDNLIDEAIDKRNSLVETLYNCKIRQTVCSSYDHGPQQYLREDLALGVCNYEFCMQLYSFMSPDASYNVRNMDIDLSHPWWNQNFNDSISVTVDGKPHQYSLSGPFNLITYDSTYGIFVNKALYDQLYATGKIQVDCYQAAREGNWTFDLFTEVASAATADTNGDQAMTYDGGDIFGCTEDGNYYCMRSLFTGSGVKCVRKDTNGFLRPISAEDSDFSMISDIVDSLIDFYASGNVTVIGEKETVQCIANGQSLFNPQYLYRLHNKDEYVVYGVDFGDMKISILPFPKYNEAQEEYHSFVCNRCYGMKVARTISDPVQVSQFCEVFAYHSAKVVYPAYVQYLKTQCLCDEEAGEMLEIILSNLFFDPGSYLDGAGIGFAATKMVQMVTTKKNQFSRAISTVTSATNESLKNYADSIRTKGQA